MRSVATGKRKVCSLSRRITTVSVAPLSSSGSARPWSSSSDSLTGIISGCLSLCPGVGGVSWRRVSWYSPSANRSEAVTSGVPAWLYQRLNWLRSRPDTSSMQATKSSQVTAWPSKRSK